MHTVWSAESARERLVEEVVTIRNIRAPHFGPVLLSFDEETEKATWSAFNALQWVAHDDPDGGPNRRLQMCLWATSQAPRDNPKAERYAEASLKRLLDECGWKKTTFDERIKKGWIMLAFALNRSAADKRESEALKKHLDNRFNANGLRTPHGRINH